ncbi:hypothetical protein FACS1894202_13130 [Clostridia bacterium]|nr:hypothetical protein FACS1894202_13130 [Clostridia bacterium]
MKALDAVFDLVLLIVILAAFLGFVPNALGEIQNMTNWGFTPNDDKTMQVLSGDIETAGYVTDKYSAAEIVLTTRVADYPATQNNAYILPDGSEIDITFDYNANKKAYTTQAKNAVNPTKTYRYIYDYSREKWVVTE